MGAIRRVSFRECQGEAEHCKAVCREPPGIYGQCTGTGTVQPKDLDASEIEARLGVTWISPDYITEFMAETFHTPRQHINYERIKVQYAEVTGQWNVKGKNVDSSNNPLSTATYGTQRANAYRLLEDALNLRDTKIYDTIHDADGEHRY